jgi:ribosomal protein L30/L7E
MSWAVVRVRGQINVKPKIKETMRLMRLNRVNHCVIIPESTCEIVDSLGLSLGERPCILDPGQSQHNLPDLVCYQSNSRWSRFYGNSGRTRSS